MTFSLLTAPERNAVYYGDAETSAPERAALVAGPLSLIYENGDLRHIKYGETEIIRRIYMTVRGDDWSTPTPVLTEIEREIGPDAFRIVYEARATLTDKGIDFLSRHTLTGTAEGNVTYAFDGEALSDFKRNRLGICVLHPPTQGAACTVTHPEGAEEAGRFPTTIKPDQPFFDIAAITQEIAPGVTSHIAFTGEVFEMEDQRNWLDASFKTYSTPQERPKPVEQPVGSHVAQSVTLTVTGATPVEATSGNEPVAVIIGAATGHVYPGIGLILPDGERPSSGAARAIAGIRIEHLRVDVDAASGDIGAAVTEAARQAKRLDIDNLLVAVRNADKLTSLPALEGATAAAYLAVDPSPETLAHLRQIVGGAAQVGAAHSGEFVNLNRNRPEAGTADVLAFADAPQVHATDVSSIMETPPTLQMQLETIAGFAPGVSMIAGPLTFYRPKRGPDARLTGLMGAAWYAGVIAYAAQGGASRITLCQIAGDEGVVGADGGAYPLYAFLGALGVATGGQVQTLAVSDPLKAAGLAVSSDEGGFQDVFVANLTRESVIVSVSGLLGQEARVRTLDETSTPRFGESTPVQTLNGKLNVTLLPFAVAQIIAGKAVG